MLFFHEIFALISKWNKKSKNSDCFRPHKTCFRQCIGFLNFLYSCKKNMQNTDMTKKHKGEKDSRDPKNEYQEQFKSQMISVSCWKSPQWGDSIMQVSITYDFNTNMILGLIFLQKYKILSVNFPYYFFFSGSTCMINATCTRLKHNFYFFISSGEVENCGKSLLIS